MLKYFNEESFWLTPYWKGDMFGPNGEACALGALDIATGFDNVLPCDAIDEYPQFRLEDIYPNILTAVVLLNDGYHNKDRYIEGNPAVARKVLYRCLIAAGLLKEESVKNIPQPIAV